MALKQPSSYQRPLLRGLFPQSVSTQKCKREAKNVADDQRDEKVRQRLLKEIQGLLAKDESEEQRFEKDRRDWEDSELRVWMARAERWAEIGKRLTGVWSSYGHLPATRQKSEFQGWCTRERNAGNLVASMSTVTKARALADKWPEIQGEIEAHTGNRNPEESHGVREWNLSAWSAGRVFESQRTEAESKEPVSRVPENMTRIRAEFREAGYLTRVVSALETATTPHDTGYKIKGPLLEVYHLGVVRGVYVKNRGKGELACHRSLTEEEKRWMECDGGEYPVVYTPQDVQDLMTQWAEEEAT